MRKQALGLTAFSVMALFASAAQAEVSGIAIGDAWIRALPAGVPDGGYFTLHNGGNTGVSLTGATSPACGMVMLHQSSDMGGMSHMDDIASVDVAAGATVKFAPGGMHLMCMNPSAAVKPGGKIAVTLRFVDGSQQTAEFVVRDATGH
jgi:copper(I)-binding protein